MRTLAGLPDVSRDVEEISTVTLIGNEIQLEPAP
jgi:hypothetical protein